MIRLLPCNIFGHRASNATTITKNDYREKVTMIVRFVSAEKWYIVLVWTAGCLCWESSLRCPPAASPEQCTLRHGNLNEHFLRCNGKSVLIIKSDEVTSVELTCTNNYTLESGPLPAFNTTKTFPVVKIARCPPPSVGYRAALLRLNISGGSNLTLKFAKNHSHFVLKGKLFESLNLSKLSVGAHEEKPMKTDEKFLRELGNLTDLQLWNVVLDNATLARVLPALVYLELHNTGVDGLDLSGARRLVEAAVTGPVAGLTLGPNLRKLRLEDVRSLELRECAALRELHVRGAGALPSDWLSNCSVEILTIKSYDAREWRAPSALRRLEIMDSDLRGMPRAPPLLRDARHLEVLRLEHCHLDVIPEELFRNASGLKTLDLSRNPLGSQLCGAWGAGGALRGLESLVAVNVSAAGVCAAWRRLPHLRHVDLQLNHIHDLGLEDLEWAGEGEVTVEVGGPVRGLRLGAGREERVAATARVRLRAVWALNCTGCQEAARVARALGSGTPAWLRAARCAPAPPAAGLRACLSTEGGPTSSQCFHIATHSSCSEDEECPTWRSATEPGGSEAECPLGDVACPEHCHCVATLDRTEQRCDGAGLVALPTPARPPPHLPPLAVLHLANNRIADLRAQHLAAFPDLTNLMLTNNLISTLDDETVAALFAGNRSVALAGNPLRCACARALLRAVAERPRRVDAAARCADLDVSLHDAARAGLGADPACAPLLLLPMLLLPAAALAVALAAALAAPALRARLKLLLLECGPRGPRAEPAGDGDRPHDAYVSAAAEDAALAAELAARLEGAGRRVCLPDRDWAPGAWVPAEIARSVRGARRTVALVSARGVRAAGARAALREAAGAGRLVVVLLPGCAPAAAAAAAPELRAHLAAVTYLRWEEPRFWPRLLLAVPPRPAASS